MIRISWTTVSPAFAKLFSQLIIQANPPRIMHQCNLRAMQAEMQHDLHDMMRDSHTESGYPMRTETVIIPANCDRYTIPPHSRGVGSELGLLSASIRS